MKFEGKLSNIQPNRIKTKDGNVYCNWTGYIQCNDDDVDSLTKVKYVQFTFDDLNQLIRKSYGIDVNELFKNNHSYDLIRDNRFVYHLNEIVKL